MYQCRRGEVGLLESTYEGCLLSVKQPTMGIRRLVHKLPE